MAPRSNNVTLSILIAGEDKGASKAIRGTRREVQGLNQDLTGTANVFSGQLAGSLAQGFASYEGFQQLQTAAQAASSLNEAQNTTGQIFERTQDQVREWGRSAVDSFGLSERAALQFANMYGGLLQNVGLAEQQAADEAMRLVALAPDLAAAWDKPVEQALNALRSGIVGEMEPLRDFGIRLDDARLRQEAMNQGIYDGTGILTANQKALAALAVITQDSSKAAGQYAREADGLAQRQQRATAAAEDARAAFGQGLLPIFTSLNKAVGSAAQTFANLPEPVQRGVSVLAALGLGLTAVSFAAGTVVPAIRSGAASLVAFSAAAKATTFNAIVSSKAVEGLGTATFVQAQRTTMATRVMQLQVAQLGYLKSGLAAAAAGFVAFETTMSIQRTLNAVSIDTRALTEDLEQLAKGLATPNQAVGLLAADMTDLAQAVRLAADDYSIFEKAMAGIGTFVPAAVDHGDIIRAQDELEALDQTLADMVAGGNVEGARQAYGQLAAALIRQGVATEDVAAVFPTYWDEVERSGRANSEGASGIDENTAALERQESAAKRARDAVQRSMDRADALRSAERSVADAHRDTATAQEELAEARRAATGDSDQYRAAVEAVADAEAAVTEANEDLVLAKRDAQTAQEDLNDAYEEARDRLVEVAQAARDAALAELDAQLKLKEARNELDRVTANPKASALEKERAALEVKKAEEEARQAAEDKTIAERENQQAQAEGVDRAPMVLDAKERIREANERVTEAERRVADAVANVSRTQQVAAKVITDAKARVEDAARRLETAVLDEAEAWRDLGSAQGGPIRGAQAYLDFLTQLEAKLDPASPLYQRVVALQEDVTKALMLGEGISSGSYATGGTGIPGYRYPDQAPAGPRGMTGGASINVTNINQGTPTQQRRANQAATERTLDEFFRGGRGG